MSKEKAMINSRLWKEEPEPDNPFAARTCYCAGYDVYGDLLGKITWHEYFYLMLKGEGPQTWQTRMLESISVILANPGLRDYSVRAAMNGGVGRTTCAASLIAALGVGSGQLGGARDVYNAMAVWNEYGMDLEAWQAHLSKPAEPDRDKIDAWLPTEHPAGFDPHGKSCTTPVLQSLDHLRTIKPCTQLDWLATHRTTLEHSANMPLAMTGVIAAAFQDLGLEPDQGEMLFLVMRLPGAAAHALEQKKYGFARYPFWPEGLTILNDPGPYQATSQDSALEGAL